MGETFGIVVIAVAILAVLVALAIAIGSRGLYDTIGSGGFERDADTAARSAAGASAADDEEIRQMVDARNARRAQRGEAPLDVEEEIRRLTPAPTADPALREELRQLVEARNARLVARGAAPLDIDAEVERRLRELG